MTPQLEEESERLVRSWMRHDAEMLGTYLVADVEDPRLNLQSLLSRHFLLRALFGERFEGLMAEEGRFALAMNWLRRLFHRGGGPEAAACVLYALERRADNVEGIDIPEFMAQTFAALPKTVGDRVVPNYVRTFLEGAVTSTVQAGFEEPQLRTFFDVWRTALAFPGGFPPEAPRLSVLEPACGSANDYRGLVGCGLDGLVDYTGFDLCSRNVENARALFPAARFQAGNVFEIPAAEGAFDLCFAHDLFEHLSMEGLEAAVAELCRVTRQGISIGFFNMDEIPDHEVRPVEEYHWNRLSMGRVRALFARQGFAAQVIHIGTFLREQFGGEDTHNPNAYTFYLTRSAR